jgi:hypothetical protein
LSSWRIIAKFVSRTRLSLTPAHDRVIKLSKDAVVVDRANRYKPGEVWARPKPAEAASVQ